MGNLKMKGGLTCWNEKQSLGQSNFGPRETVCGYGLLTPNKEVAEMRAIYFAILTIALLLASCSTMRKTLVAGAAVGATTGTFAGATAARKDKKEAALKGALIGGLLGAVMGWFTHKRLEKRDYKTRRELLLKLERLGSPSKKLQSQGDLGPSLSEPVVDSEWRDARIEGNKLIEGHRVWIIKENPQWVPSGDNGEQSDRENGGER